MTSSDNLSKPPLTKLNRLIYALIGISLVGFLDAVYLTTSHYTGHITCSVVSGCQEVLVSQYSEVFGIPLAILGAAYYLFILIISLFYFDSQRKIFLKTLSYIPIIGFLISLYLIYLQLFVIHAICQYCMLSALTSTLIFILSIFLIKIKKYYV